MTHEEFIQKRKAGTIAAGIDRSTALKLIDYLPKRYQYAHIFWSWIWGLSIPAFICVSIFYKWWLGLLLLFIVTPLIFHSIKKASADFVFEYAEENKEFFDMLVKNNILIFKDVNNNIIDLKELNR